MKISVFYEISHLLCLFFMLRERAYGAHSGSRIDVEEGSGGAGRAWWRWSHVAYGLRLDLGDGSSIAVWRGLSYIPEKY
jgi:hypothetical protein